MHQKLTLLMCLFPIFLFGQASFATLGSTWKYEFHTLDCNDAFVVYSIEDEVTVDGKNCHVISAYTSYEGSGYEKHTDSLIVWEDSSKVYFVHEDSFYLLYDFDLAIGDTLDYYIPPSSKVFTRIYDSVYLEPVHVNLSVEYIDTMNRNGKDHIIYNTYYAGIGPEAYMMGRINKGIGSMSETIVGQIGFFVGEGCGGFLHCHETDVLHWGSGATCDTISNTAEQYAISDFSFYPNPVESKINITNWEQIESYQIANLNGQIIASSVMVSDVISLNNFEAGIYFILLKTNNLSVIPIKFIKI